MRGSASYGIPPIPPRRLQARRSAPAIGMCCTENNRRAGHERPIVRAGLSREKNIEEHFRATALGGSQGGRAKTMTPVARMIQPDTKPQPNEQPDARTATYPARQQEPQRLRQRLQLQSLINCIRVQGRRRTLFPYLFVLGLGQLPLLFSTEEIWRTRHPSQPAPTELQPH